MANSYITTDEDRFKIIDLYFREQGFIQHQLESYNNFIDILVNKVISQNNTIEIQHSKKDVTKLVFGEVVFSSPSFTEIDSEKREITPAEAKHRNMTYSSDMYIDITVTKPNGEEMSIEHFFIGKMPVMVRSNLCNIKDFDELDCYRNGECPMDIGGYFIVNGSPKVVVSQERTAFNKPYLFKNRKQAPRFDYYTEIRSSAVNGAHTTTTQVGIVKEHLYVLVPYIPDKNAIPLGILFKALGAIEEEEIVSYITDDENLIEELCHTLEHSYPCRSQEEALLYIGKKGKKFSNDIQEEDEQEEIIEKDEEDDENMNAVSYARHLLTNELFPHIGKDFSKKRYYLGAMVAKVLDVWAKKKNYVGKRKWFEVEKEILEDRDHYANKRIDTVGTMMHNLFYIAWKKLKADCKINCEKILSKGNRDINPITFIKNTTITAKMTNCLSTGNWSSTRVTNSKKNGVSQMFEKFNYNASFSNLRKTNAPLGNEGKILDPRRLHGSSWGFICPFETPEGKSCGLSKNLALTTYISVGYEPTDFIELLKTTRELVHFEDSPKYLNYTKVIVNGDWVGFVEPVNAMSLYQRLKRMKRQCQINPDTSIVFQGNQIRICTDCGRLMRPLFLVEEDHLVATKEDIDLIDEGNMDLMTLLEKGIIEFVDAEEQNMSEYLIANHPNELGQRHFTHCELHPSVIIGVGTTSIPFPNCNPSPRVTYQASMTKQAVGVPYLNFNQMMDGSIHLLNYPQRPLVANRNLKVLGYEDMPSGQNAIVAILPFSGWNQEDSVILNKSAVERGLFRTTYLVHYSGENKKDEGLIFEIPKREECNAFKCSRTDHLDEEGIVNVGSIVYKGDVLIARTQTIAKDELFRKEKTDMSITFSDGEVGVVEKVQKGMNAKGYDFVKVKIAIVRVPAIGDKFASRFAQKGTCGMLYRQEDMPFNRDGICPDIIINSLAIPSRMTIGQLIECVMGKKCSSTDLTLKEKSTLEKNMNNYSKDHTIGNATPWIGSSVHDVRDVLKKMGYDSNGNEMLINGMTGEPMNAMIFMGPTYYQRLKHMVTDKIHVRARGPMQSLLRQPTDGRAQSGGLRLGEMERDCLIGQGASYFIKDRLFENSDKYKCFICDVCGQTAIQDKNLKQSYCRVCDEATTSCIQIPYATKLLFQELIAMNMVPRLMTS